MGTSISTNILSLKAQRFNKIANSVSVPKPQQHFISLLNFEKAYFLAYSATKHKRYVSGLKMVEIVQEMRLFSGRGERLYLTAEERKRFLTASREESRENRIFCSVLHYTGCRPSEALELKPSSINIEDREIVFRTLKKRKYDNQGRIKLPQYRAVPVPENVIDEVDLVFDLRRNRQIKKLKDIPLWDMSRATAWRMIKRVMKRADIEGKQATSKGLRHGFGIAMLSGEKALPLNNLRDLMGHSDTKITEIYLQASGKEKRDLVMKAWE